MGDQEKCTRPPSRTHRQPSAESPPTLNELAEAALQRISRYPAALDPSPERRARWLSAAAKMAGAAADFAVLAAEGNEDAFLEEGAIGDALLVSRAAEAARSVVEAQEQSRTIGYFAIRSEWGDFGAPTSTSAPSTRRPTSARGSASARS